MAVKIPVVVDIEGGVKDAIKKTPKAVNELQKAVDKNPLQIKFKNLSINEINSELSKLTAQWNKMTKAQKFDDKGKLTDEARALVKQYQMLTKEADKFGVSLDKTATRAKRKTKNLNTELDNTNSKLLSLVKNSARLFALHAVSSFLRNIRDVTAQFELQKVALGSIIQDTEYANTLFKKIKAAAVESPFQIKELVTYTKQLSAYQIETEKLFDTTMKLADISAGLGVDMGRLILAFGQVRAAAVLRGQELRQFTEAGIPLVDRLAQKFTELNGRLVTTTEVFELISKRAVPFAMIEEIFDDMTSAGGSFYRMQEKQAETLLGQWNNLKDSISIMYDEIGNTSAVHGAMSKLIGDAKSVMLHWRDVANMVKYLGIQYGAMKLATAFLPTLTRNTKLAEKADIAYAKAKTLSNRATKNGNKFLMAQSESLQLYAKYTKKAANATTQWGRSINKLKAYLAGNWIALVGAAIMTIAAAIGTAIKRAGQLNRELSKIESEGGVKIDQSVRNFERLAKKALAAADGSKEQSDAVAELKRTYGDLLPEQNKVIAKLQEMEGDYRSVTDAIRENIQAQILEQKIEQITSDYGKDIGRREETLKKALKKSGFSSDEVSGIFSEIKEAVRSGLIDIEDEVYAWYPVINDIFETATGESNVFLTKGGFSTDVWRKTSYDFVKLIKLYSGMESKISDVTDEMRESTGVTGIFHKAFADMQKDIEGITTPDDKLTTKFAKNEDRIRQIIERWRKMIWDILEMYSGEGPYFGKAKGIEDMLKSGGPLDFDALNKWVEELDPKFKDSATKALNKIQKEYEKLVPDDMITKATKAKLIEISKATGISMDNLRSHIKAAGKDSQEYLKELGETIEQYKNKADELAAVGEKGKGLFPFDSEANEKAIAENREMANALQVLYDWISQIIKLPQKGGSDALQKLRADISDIQNAYKKFLELRKYETRGQALSDIGVLFPGLKGWQPTYANMISRLENLLTKYRGNADATRLIQQAIANIKFDKLKDEMDDAIKRLSEDMKRSETARNFFNDILGLTGDEGLATNLTLSIYGDTGRGFKERVQEELKTALGYFDDMGDMDLLGKMREAVAGGDFKTILKYLDRFPEEWQKRLKEMADSDQKYQAEQIQGWLKELSEFKTYGEKRVRLAQQTAEKIAEINASGRSREQKASLIEGYQRKEAEESAKLQYEAFKNSSMYIELFENLDTASMKMLTNMRDRLIGLRKQLKDLDPVQLKEMSKRIEEVNGQLAKRNPFKALADGLREYMQLQKNRSRAEADQAAIDKLSKQIQEEKKLEAALKAVEQAQKNYDLVKKAKGADSIEAKSAKATLDSKKRQANKQQKITDNAIKEANAAQEAADAYKRAAQRIKEGADALSEWASLTEQALGGIGEIVSTFSNKETAETFNTISSGISKTLSGTAKTAGSLARLVSGDFTAIPALIQGIGDLLSGIFGTSRQLKVERLNREIRDQGRLLDRLEESYDKLSKAMDKTFGNERVYNFNKALETLEAEVEAYNKQAAAERAKGKDKDEDAILGYEKSARDAMERINELRDSMRQAFAGSDLASAAESFADAWLSAYAEFGDTAGAIEERMTEMVQNLVKKAALSGIAQAIMGDWYESLSQIQDWNAKTVAQKWQEAMALVGPMVDGMQTFASSLQAEGVSLRNTSGQFSGIARNIAGATEESINGLAAGVNTQNFFMQRIEANVAAILAIISGGAQGSSNSPTGVSSTDLMLQYVSCLPTIDQNLAELLRKVSSVISPKNAATNTHYVSVK